ncbi:MAG: glycosyltransferase [Lachnospiraceae bacterium]|nr:glycosyltransferase [Lachnospiraceae bacterium]
MDHDNKPKVSIIVPVWNAERHLKGCFDSLRRQTYENIEIIFSDDGSSDGSSEMLSRFAAADPRVKVLHQENKGIAEARNAGLKACSGKYVMFMDDDDLVPKSYVEKFLCLIEGSGAHVAVGGYRRVTEDMKLLETRRIVGPGTHVKCGGCRRVSEHRKLHKTGRLFGSGTHVKCESCRSVSEHRILHKTGRLFGSGTHLKSGSGTDWLRYILVVPWGKIYRKSFLDDACAEFLPSSIDEDMYFWLKLLSYYPKIAFTDYAGYVWVKHPDSVSNTLHRRTCSGSDIIPPLEKVLDMYDERDVYLDYFIYRHCVRNFLYTSRGESREVIVKEFKRIQEWLLKNDCSLKICPFSPRLSGERVDHRLAVFCLWLTGRFHGEGLLSFLISRCVG